MNLPAYCHSCGLVFSSPMAASGAIGLKVTNVQVTCPRCGEMASVLEGVMNVAEETIELISGPAWSHKVLSEIRGIVLDLRAGQISQHEAIEKAAAIDPLAGQTLRSWLSIGIPFALLLLEVLQMAWSRADIEANRQTAARREVQVERMIEAFEGISRGLDQRVVSTSDQMPQPHPHDERAKVEANEKERERAHQEAFRRQLVRDEIAAFEGRKKPLKE